jgi:hypothetical protein
MISAIRPEAKLGCWVLEIARTKSQQIFYSALAVETLYPHYPRVTIAQRDLTPAPRPTTNDQGPYFACHIVALFKFSIYKIIWPAVMALACGSLHTAVTSVPSGWHISS